MFDAENNLIEGTKSNVFIFHENYLKTPLLTSNGVKGIMRQRILEQANALGIKTKKSKIDLPLLKNAAEVFVCNSIIKIWPVKAIGEQQFSVGPVTKNQFH
ncbi:unnamed protein product [marine sediment metagenome]|uniref:Aminotransferase class IV n=1 Tax=marine sediment metagenome TaxID=412755 RepID=X1EMD0_9ZZZZ